MTAGELLRNHGWEPLERPDKFPLWRKGDSGPVELAEALTIFHREAAADLPSNGNSPIAQAKLDALVAEGRALIRAHRIQHLPGWSEPMCAALIAMWAKDPQHAPTRWQWLGDLPAVEVQEATHDRP